VPPPAGPSGPVDPVKVTQLPTPEYCYSIAVLPTGSWIIPGKFASHDGGRTWQELDLPLSGDIQVHPFDPQVLLDVEGLLSEDGGRTWKQVFSRMQFECGGRKCMIFGVMWSVRDPTKVLLQQFGASWEKHPSEVAGDRERAAAETGTLFLFDVKSQDATRLSKTDRCFVKYERVGTKHFAALGLNWTEPGNCVVSEDDGVTWTAVAVEKTPWSLYAKAQGQVDALLPVAERASTKAGRPEHPSCRIRVTWAQAFRDQGVAFCGIRRVWNEGRPALGTEAAVMKSDRDSSTSGVFVSLDQGDTWKRAQAKGRTNAPETLFAESPFVWTGKDGQTWVDATWMHGLKLDRERGLIFGSVRGVCYVTTLSSPHWYPLNQHPKATVGGPGVPLPPKPQPPATE